MRVYTAPSGQVNRPSPGKVKRLMLFDTLNDDLLRSLHRNGQNSPARKAAIRATGQPVWFQSTKG
jgi:hypothetical protein